MTYKFITSVHSCICPLNIFILSLIHISSLTCLKLNSWFLIFLPNPTYSLNSFPSPTPNSVSGISTHSIAWTRNLEVIFILSFPPTHIQSIIKWILSVTYFSNLVLNITSATESHLQGKGSDLSGTECSIRSFKSSPGDSNMWLSVRSTALDSQLLWPHFYYYLPGSLNSSYT